MFSIDLTVLLTFSLLWAAIVPTPGANSLLITHLALTRSWRQVAYAIAGNMIGIFLLAICALAGMAILLEIFPWLRLAVHVFGGLYLIYFGLRLLNRARNATQTAGPSRPSSGVEVSNLKMVTLGFSTALSNAQAIVFITSIFAVGGVLKASLATGLACIAAMIILNAGYLSFLAWLFFRPLPRRIYLRFRRAIEGSIGVLFTFFGGRLIFKELT